MSVQVQLSMQNSLCLFPLLCLNESGWFYFIFLQTLCILRIILLWRTDDLGKMRLSFSFSDSFDFEDFSPPPLGENRCFGESESLRS